MNFEIAYFGEKGSFTSIVAQKRYANAKLVSIPTVPEVVKYVQENKRRLGVVPIENSSGGFINETIDALINKSCNLFIQEELGVKVKLALLGRKNEEIKHIYSHFAPLNHCESWLKKNYPRAELHQVTSTTQAAKWAAHNKNSAAISTKNAAAIYELEILKYPLIQHIENMTQFFTLGHEPNPKGGNETSLIVALKNVHGSLQKFLKPFSDERLNLKRIVSRNVMGHPNTYVFFIGVEANEQSKSMKRALNAAARYAQDIRTLGSYPAKAPYSS